MMPVLKVVIPGEPVAQGRPRSFRLPGGGVRAYDPAKSRNWKAEAHIHMAKAVEEAAGLLVAFPLGPCEALVTAVFTCPKSDCRRKEPRKRRRHPKRPDAENVAKAVLDAGTGVLWADDSQVARLVVEKWIGAQGERPYVQIEVRGFGDGA